MLDLYKLDTLLFNGHFEASTIKELEKTLGTKEKNNRNGDM